MQEERIQAESPHAAPFPPPRVATRMNFKPNDKLRHAGKPEWGVGVVLAAQQASHEGKPCQRLTVRFDNAGKKTITTAFADLRPFDPAQSLPQNPLQDTTLAPARAPDQPRPRPAPASSKPTNHTHHADDANHAAESFPDPASARRRLAAIPDAASDPFLPLPARLRETLNLYQFEPQNRSLLDWASIQSGLRDPLSQFSRHELEQHFQTFRINLDRHLKDLLADARKAGLDTAPFLAAAPAPAHHALRRINPNR